MDLRRLKETEAQRIATLAAREEYEAAEADSDVLLSEYLDILNGERAATPQRLAQVKAAAEAANRAAEGAYRRWLAVKNAPVLDVSAALAA